MARLGFVAVAVAVLLVWFFALRTMMVLVVPGVILAGVWIWWEIRELRRAMRMPPRR